MIGEVIRKAKERGVHMRRSLRVAAVVVTLMMTIQGVLFAASIPGSANDTDPNMELRVMTFNIFYGGDEMNLDTSKFCLNPEGCEETLEQIVTTILASEADIVGLQEGMMNTGRIADWLTDVSGEKWHCNERMQIISRYPLADPSGGDGMYIFVEPVQGRVAALTNVHLPAEPYSPYEVRDGATLEEVLEIERIWRVEESVVSESPSIEQLCGVLPSLLSQDIPLFFTGDFNTPSHLDWTGEVAAIRDVVSYPIAWPVSEALFEVGFRDSYRDIHPDPVTNPGFTWTPGSLDGVEDEVHDRVDWILSAGPSTTLDSQLMGEPGNPEVDIVVDPWPSDHRSVVSTFDVTLGIPPSFVAVDKRSLEIGDVIEVSYHAPGEDGERIAITRAGEDPDDAVASLSTEGAVDGSLEFATDAWNPDAYEAVLVDDTGSALERIPFWLYEQGAVTTVTTSKGVYEIGEPIIVTWTNALGLFGDWMGIFRGIYSSNSLTQTVSYAGWGTGNSAYLMWEYTHASIEGTMALSESSPGSDENWPLQPGNYEIRYLLDDQYRCVASSARFQVV